MHCIQCTFVPLPQDRLQPPQWALWFCPCCLASTVSSTMPLGGIPAPPPLWAGISPGLPPPRYTLLPALPPSLPETPLCQPNLSAQHQSNGSSVGPREGLGLHPEIVYTCVRDFWHVSELTHQDHRAFTQGKGTNVPNRTSWCWHHRIVA